MNGNRQQEEIKASVRKEPAQEQIDSNTHPVDIAAAPVDKDPEIDFNDPLIQALETAYEHEMEPIRKLEKDYDDLLNFIDQKVTPASFGLTEEQAAMPVDAFLDSIKNIPTSELPQFNFNEPLAEPNPLNQTDVVQFIINRKDPSDVHKE